MAKLPSPREIRDLMPFAVLVGIELLETGPELVRGRLAWSPEHCTTGALLHGGAMMALADTCGGVCAFLNIPDGAEGTSTIASATNFFHPVREGSIIASTRPVHAGATTIVVESEIKREDGSLAAKVTQTQAFHFPRIRT